MRNNLPPSCAMDLIVNGLVFTDLPYEAPRRSAWTSHGHPTPQSKGTVLAPTALNPCITGQWVPTDGVNDNFITSLLFQHIKWLSLGTEAQLIFKCSDPFSIVIIPLSIRKRNE